MIGLGINLWRAALGGGGDPPVEPPVDFSSTTETFDSTEHTFDED